MGWRCWLCRIPKHRCTWPVTGLGTVAADSRTPRPAPPGGRVSPGPPRPSPPGRGGDSRTPQTPSSRWEDVSWTPQAVSSREVGGAVDAGRSHSCSPESCRPLESAGQTGGCGEAEARPGAGGPLGLDAAPAGPALSGGGVRTQFRGRTPASLTDSDGGGRPVCLRSAVLRECE